MGMVAKTQHENSAESIPPSKSELNPECSPEFAKAQPEFSQFTRSCGEEGKREKGGCYTPSREGTARGKTGGEAAGAGNALC